MSKRKAKGYMGKGPARSDGRLIVSYPKSGRTWLRFAFDSAGIKASLSHAGAATNRREIGWPFRGIPPALNAVPLVFLHRDPIDTAVSMFYQVNRRDLRRGSGRWWRMLLPLALRGALPPTDIDAFVLHPIYGVEKVCTYNRAWLDHLEGRSDCLIMTYEAMRANPAEGFQSILDFWGEKSTTGAALAAASTFETMKAVEAGRTGPATLRAATVSDANSAKVRKGNVRGFFDELAPETIKRALEIASRHGFTVVP